MVISTLHLVRNNAGLKLISQQLQGISWKWIEWDMAINQKNDYIWFLNYKGYLIILQISSFIMVHTGLRLECSANFYPCLKWKLLVSSHICFAIKYLIQLWLQRIRFFSVNCNSNAFEGSKHYFKEQTNNVSDTFPNLFTYTTF